MTEKKYEQRFDLYYVATIFYLVTLIIYGAVKGTLIGERFELVWKDPIVYLLAICAVVSLIGLAYAFIVRRSVKVTEDRLHFQTRFRERTISPAEIDRIRVGRGSRGKIRSGAAERAIRIILKSSRRRLVLRPSMFDDSQDLKAELLKWIERNGVKYGPKRSES